MGEGGAGGKHALPDRNVKVGLLPIRIYPRRSRRYIQMATRMDVSEPAEGHEEQTTLHGTPADMRPVAPGLSWI
jgi:hypothetical protein